MAPRWWPRFAAKIAPTEPGGCWLWTGATTVGNGGHRYGNFRLDGSARRAHRVAYESVFGRLEPGIVLDHLCHRKLCVNPAHLRPVGQAQNMENRRGPNSNSTSGVRNVHWKADRQQWRVKVRDVHGGYFDSLTDAAAAASRLRATLFEVAS